MLAVLMLFLLPVGGGIPAGVLLAKAKGLPWGLTALFYFLSDAILALCFEPLLRAFVALGRRVAWMARLGEALRMATARTVAQLGGAGAGPLALILIAFGVDPMTGRTAALAAGHGIWSGWALAIAGDMLYYAVVAMATLRLNAWLHDPTLTVGLILLAMILAPSLVRRLRTQVRLRRVAG
jgi:hypothetical protein